MEKKIKNNRTKKKNRITDLFFLNRITYRNLTISELFLKIAKKLYQVIVFTNI